MKPKKLPIRVGDAVRVTHAYRPGIDPYWPNCWPRLLNAAVGMEGVVVRVTQHNVQLRFPYISEEMQNHAFPPCCLERINQPEEFEQFRFDWGV